MSGDARPSAFGEALAAVLPDRPLRVYPAVLSAEADAMAWAREGAPAGSLVTAEYQVAPRGRGGLEWEVRPGLDVAFSLVLRPELPEELEGWLYSVVATALSDVLDGSSIRWPDELHRGEQLLARTGVQTAAEDGRLAWVVVSVLLREVQGPTAIAAAVQAIQRRLDQDTREVLDDHRSRVSTIGERVRARMVPMGPSGVVHEGEAVGVRNDGGIAIRTGDGSLLRIVPRALGLLERVEPDAPAARPGSP